MPVTHIQNRAPGPPAAMAVATPAMLPVPTVAARAVIRAWKWEMSPSAPFSRRRTATSPQLSGPPAFRSNTFATVSPFAVLPLTRARSPLMDTAPPTPPPVTEVSSMTCPQLLFGQPALRLNTYRGFTMACIPLTETDLPNFWPGWALFATILAAWPQLLVTLQIRPSFFP